MQYVWHGTGGRAWLEVSAGAQPSAWAESVGLSNLDGTVSKLLTVFLDQADCDSAQGWKIGKDTGLWLSVGAKKNDD